MWDAGEHGGGGGGHAGGEVARAAGRERQWDGRCVGCGAALGLFSCGTGWEGAAASVPGTALLSLTAADWSWIDSPRRRLPPSPPPPLLLLLLLLLLPFCRTGTLPEPRGYSSFSPLLIVPLFFEKTPGFRSGELAETAAPMYPRHEGSGLLVLAVLAGLQVTLPSERCFVRRSYTGQFRCWVFISPGCVFEVRARWSGRSTPPRQGTLHGVRFVNKTPLCALDDRSDQKVGPVRLANGPHVFKSNAHEMLRW